MTLPGSATETICVIPRGLNIENCTGYVANQRCLVRCADSVMLRRVSFFLTSASLLKALKGFMVSVNHASLDAAYLHIELKIDGDKTMVIMY